MSAIKTPRALRDASQVLQDALQKYQGRIAMELAENALLHAKAIRNGTGVPDEEDMDAGAAVALAGAAWRVAYPGCLPPPVIAEMMAHYIYGGEE
jgi:hypothetical protein